jgi:hypothetical protein
VKSWASIDDWIAERPEVRYMIVEAREGGGFEARLNSDAQGDESPVQGARGERIRDAVYRLASMFKGTNGG